MIAVNLRMLLHNSTAEISFINTMHNGALHYKVQAKFWKTKLGLYCQSSLVFEESFISQTLELSTWQITGH